jgi:hypothetical protein
MNGATLAEKYKDLLTKQGFLPTIDDDGDVRFPYEGKKYYLMADDEDPEFFHLARVNIWSIDSEEERAKAEAVTLELSGRIKCVKMYVTDDDVWISCEMFCSPIEHCQSILSRALSAVQLGERTFAESMRGERSAS